MNDGSKGRNLLCIIIALLLILIVGYNLYSGLTIKEIGIPSIIMIQFEEKTPTPLPTITTAMTSTVVSEFEEKTPTPSPTVTTAITSTATKIPPTPTPKPTCAEMSGPFADTWNSVQTLIGCAANSAITDWMAEEDFERGKMFWSESKLWGEPTELDQILVLFDDRTWQIVEHPPFKESDPEFSCHDSNTPSQCPPTPKRGFGKLWCESPDIRRRLGNATDCEKGHDGWFQQFGNGFMLQTDNEVVYIFYNDQSWESH